jgi:hypothetical protein
MWHPLFRATGQAVSLPKDFNPTVFRTGLPSIRKHVKHRARTNDNLTKEITKSIRPLFRILPFSQLVIQIETLVTASGTYVLRCVSEEIVELFLKVGSGQSGYGCRAIYVDVYGHAKALPEWRNSARRNTNNVSDFGGLGIACQTRSDLTFLWPA